MIVCASTRKPLVGGAREPVKVEERRICEVFSGCRCTICGAYFGDSDDICANGHEIGCSYE